MNALESDQRFYHVPCAHCGAFQVLKWKRIEWPEGRPEEAQYRCLKCEKLIPHHLKAGMVARGKWTAANPSSRIAGIHLSELYSPWRPWGELAADWLKSQGNIERMRGNAASMRLASFTVGELVITILRVPTNVRVRAIASDAPSPSAPAESSHLSSSSINRYRIGRDARPAGLFAPTMEICPSRKRR